MGISRSMRRTKNWCIHEEHLLFMPMEWIMTMWARLILLNWQITSPQQTLSSISITKKLVCRWSTTSKTWIREARLSKKKTILIKNIRLKLTCISRLNTPLEQIKILKSLNRWMRMAQSREEEKVFLKWILFKLRLRKMNQLRQNHWSFKIKEVCKSKISKVMLNPMSMRHLP